MTRNGKTPWFRVFQDEGLLLQACITGDGSESGRAISHLSAVTIKSFRESGSFRHYTVSSAASSPGWIPKGKIDPSTYSFSEALKDLQKERCGSGRELSMASMRFLEGKILNSKWDEAERYISNPLSGEVPIQCLSSYVASRTRAEHARPVPVFTRTFMSAPLSFPAEGYRAKPHPISIPPLIEEVNSKGDEELVELKGRTGSWMRDVGTQITPLDCSSSSPSITLTAEEEDRTESSRLTGRCFIFQRRPKSKDVVEENKENPEKRTKTEEINKLRKTVKSCISLRWKTWFKNKSGHRYNDKAGKDSTEKAFTIITIQATLEQ